MINIIISQLLRTKRMPIRVATLLCPILYVALFCLYLLSSETLTGVELYSYFGIFSIISNFAISFFIPMLYEPDKEACLYANELRIGINRRKIFISKFLLILIIVATIELLASIPFVVFIVLSRGVEIELLQLLLFMVIPFVTLMPIIIIYQFLSLKFSYSGSILVGCFLTLASILLGTTSLGDVIWKYLPFTWNIKLLFAYGREVIAAKDITVVLGESIIITVILLWCFSTWYNKWNGIAKMEE